MPQLAPAQTGDGDELLLPDAISNYDIEMRGRFVRRWRQDDGTHVLIYTGGFRLSASKRQLSASNAVVWVKSSLTDPDHRRFFDLVVYLSEQAEVREPGGTITEDSVLLVSNLRTYGKVITLQDAHSPEPAEDNELYQRALKDRARIEGQEPEAGPARDIAVRSPADAEKPKSKPRRVAISIRGASEPATTPDGEPVQVIVGGIYATQGGGANAPFLEILADNAVVFLRERAAASFVGEMEGSTSRPATEAPSAPSDAADRDESLGGLAKAVYLEGDVLLTFGERIIRASRIFYDFERDRALILDAVFHQDVPYRNVPLYIRADEVRQLSAREYSATKAKVTTSEFYSPSYHVGADKVYLRDRTQRDTRGLAVPGSLAGTYELKNATLNVANTPILFWPYSQGDIEQSETLLRRFRTGYSDDFGVEVETSWYLFNLLGITPPPGYDATLKLDYYSERGPGIGLDGKYQQADHFGLTRNYFIYDQGEDNFGPLRDNTPPSETRGRTLWRHRHYLPNDWELSLEVSYASDPGFLEEYNRDEWFEDKEQETVVYLKRAREVDAITLLANWRLLDFVTQTEHLPDLTYRRLGDVLGPFVAYHESRIGGVRHVRSDPDFRENFYNLDQGFYPDSLSRHTRTTDMTFRTDAREEAELPLKLKGLNIVPFGSIRGTYWDGQPLDSGGLWRGLGLYGVRGSAWLARVYDDVHSELLDIHRIRHIVQPDFAIWGAHSNTRSDNITPFDEGVEAIDAVIGGVVGVRNTWQTKRGGEGKQRSVDLLTWNLEAGVFGGDRPEDEQSNGYANPFRPEESRPRNYIGSEIAWRVSDTTTFFHEFNLDLNDCAADRHNISLAIERNPRLAYVLGYRHAGDIDLDLVGGGINYRFNEKHIAAIRLWYDTNKGSLGELAFSYIYKMPRWYVGIHLEFDEVYDDVSVSFSLWPEGIPEWTLGSRRFSRLGESTAIKPAEKPKE